MKRILLICTLFLAFSFSLFAHPGIGIVQDSEGNVYYTDLTHVWKISTDGTLSIAVRDVHTHELFIDANDNLFGEHIWYEGEGTDKWGHRIWCLKNDGKLIDVVPPTEGFPENNMLKRDKSGNQYFQKKEGDESVLMKKSFDGTVSRFSDHKFSDIRWICADSRSEDLNIIDHLSVKKVDCDGKVQLLSEDLKESSLPFFGVGDRHYLMGTWSDQLANTYVAAYGAKKVKKIAPDGSVEVVEKSSGGWSPSGGFIDEQENIWLLEYSKRNKARVRRISKNGASTVFQNK